jgi:hypothetical protein
MRNDDSEKSTDRAAIINNNGKQSIIRTHVAYMHLQYDSIHSMALKENHRKRHLYKIGTACFVLHGKLTRIGLSPRRHLRGVQARVVSFQFQRGFGPRDEHRVDGRLDDAHQ